MIFGEIYNQFRISGKFWKQRTVNKAREISRRGLSTTYKELRAEGCRVHGSILRREDEVGWGGVAYHQTCLLEISP